MSPQKETTLKLLPINDFFSVFSAFCLFLIYLNFQQLFEYLTKYSGWQKNAHNKWDLKMRQLLRFLPHSACWHRGKQQQECKSHQPVFKLLKSDWQRRRWIWKLHFFRNFSSPRIILLMTLLHKLKHHE